MDSPFLSWVTCEPTSKLERELEKEKRDKGNYSKKKKKVVEIFWSRAKIMVARFSIDYRYSAGQQGSVARFWRWPKVP